MNDQEFLSTLPKLPEPGQISLWDQAAIDFGIPEEMLMENAARAACQLVFDLWPHLTGKTVWLFMGGGNNGGDAACMARHLLDYGCDPVIFHTKPLASLKGASAFHSHLAQKDGVRFFHLSLPDMKPGVDWLANQTLPVSPQPPALIIDGLLGTGFTGILRDDLKYLLEAINKISKWLHAPVLAIDAPSGLNSTTGIPSPVALSATATVTFAAAKTGLLLPWARPWTGQVYCRPIGMPKALEPDFPASFRLLDGRALLNKPSFPQNSYKNRYGHILVIGGAPGMEGAAHLACTAALRSGCGLVCACAPAASLPQIKAGCPEIMTVSAREGKNWPANVPENCHAALKRASALVIGPGLGRDASAISWLKALLEIPDRPPAVIDADALTLLANQTDLLARLGERDILTPHPGEASSLLRDFKVQENRPAALQKLLGLSPATVILKGAATLTASPKYDTILLCPYDIPQLAIGGAGDVLAGCASAFLAQGHHSLAAAGYAVITHVVAGLIIATQFPDRGALASDLANALPEAGQFLAKSVASKPFNYGQTPWP